MNDINIVDEVNTLIECVRRTNEYAKVVELFRRKNI